MIHVPGEVFLTKGKGVHKEKLQSFEAALRDAGIAKFNLVYVSSIAPPKVKVISKKKGLENLVAGQIVNVVMSKNETDEAHRQITASIGLAIPKDKNMHGYISEHHAYGWTEKQTEEYAEDVAATMLATTLGIEFDADEDYDRRKEVYRMSGKIVRTQGITQSTNGNKHGLWTTVLAAAVFIPDGTDKFLEFLKEKYSKEYSAWLKSKGYNP